MKKRMILIIIVIALLLVGCAREENTIQEPISSIAPEEDTIGDGDGPRDIESTVKYDLRQIIDMDIFVDDENKVHLNIGAEDRIIYENFPDFEEMDPYSVLSFSDYLVKRSSDGKYIFINDSIYDIEKDELIPLADNVFFCWNENKGIYLADGQIIQLGYDGAIFSEFAFGKKLMIFKDGEIADLKAAPNDEYFVLNPLYTYDKTLQESVIKIPVAKLTVEIDELTETVDTGEYIDLIKEQILESGVLEALDTEYKIVLEKIKALDSYKALHESIRDNDIIESKWNTFLDNIDYYNGVFWNTDPSYFYEKIGEETIVVCEQGESEEKSDQNSMQQMFEELKADIEQINEYKRLKEDIAAYKKLAPVTFENVEIVLNMISNP